ncbi:helix-turn-helix domain-containing protein [Romboutsia lituseburensis]|uniref:helix-turn-helix domain-containing protein n=1 Tax=Romboutsia lituseburensis TaxID=1537 RepID=UPI0022EB76D7|nr:helix-turn-helix transcriptional regulator [Romboutsia lituseburensis]
MFGARLKELRLEKDMTQAELGNILNLSQRSISQYEIGIRFPDEATINAIATFFDVTTDFLFGRTKIKNIYKF